jgi:micrococcal nuclease
MDRESSTTKKMGYPQLSRRVNNTSVFKGSQNVNLDMVKVGLAEVYHGQHAPGFDPDSYDQAEKEAKEAKQGMWVQGDKYVSPREWRRIN